MSASTPNGAADTIDRAVWVVGAVVVLGTIMSILDTTIINIALETLSVELGSDLVDVQWVVTVYLLAMGAVIPVTGWAARKFGSKRLYVVSLVLFVGGSALCGIASTLTELVLARVLQGVGGGMLLPLGQMMLAEAAGPKRMGRVLSLIGVPAMLGPIFGPMLGGLLLDNASWRWIFFINIPIGVVAVLAALRFLPRNDPQPTDRIDIPGFVLLTVGVPLLIYGLAEVGVTGTFGTAKVIGPIAGGVALLVIFTVHALRAKFPLLDMRLYARATYSSASVTMFCVAGALFGGMVLLPLYYQGVRDFSVLETGLLTAPQGLGAALIMPLAGKLTDRYGGGPLAVIGVVIVTASTVPFGLVGPDTSLVGLSLAMFVRGIGIGLAFMPAMTAAYASLERNQLSHAAPQLNVLHRIGGSIGVAVLAVVLQQALIGQTTPEGAAGAYGTAFWWSTAISGLAIVPCIVLAIAERRARRTAPESPPEEPLEDADALPDGVAA
jgi:EmrB/QacA subfamily drug resistance transporter